MQSTGEVGAVFRVTTSNSADATTSKVRPCRKTTPFTAVLLIKVIAASLFGLENDKISGGRTSS